MGNRQGPIPVYSFRGNSPTWTTTAPNVRSTPGPVVSNGKWLAIPSQGFSVLLDVETGEVVPDSYRGRSNIYLPENTTPIATMGRYDGNGAAVFLDYIYSVGISNIRVTDPMTGRLVKELGFKQTVPSGCQSDNRVLAKGISVLETIPGTTWVALSMECRDGNYVINLKLDV